MRNVEEDRIGPSLRTDHTGPASGALIRKLESVASLTTEERKALGDLPMMVRTLPARQDIVREQDRASQCCLVQDGWVYRYKTLRNGNRQILSFYIPGDVPDLQSLHLDRATYSLASLTISTIAFIPHESLHGLTARHPGISGRLWRETLIDASIYQERITSLGRRSALERAAHFFCEMYCRLKAIGLARDLRYELPLTQVDLADILGITNVHINRVLKDMRQQELIAWRGGTVTIRDWSALSKSAEFDPAYLHIVGPAGP